MSTPTAGSTKLCGVHFVAPDGWTIQKTAMKVGLPGCSVGLKPPGWDRRRHEREVSVVEFPLTVTVSERSTRDVAAAAGFVRVRDLDSLPPRLRGSVKDDDWLVDSKALRKTDRIGGTTWSGAAGEAIRDHRALMIERNGRHRTAFAWCDNQTSCETVLPAFLRSFEFSQKR